MDPHKQPQWPFLIQSTNMEPHKLLLSRLTNLLLHNSNQFQSLFQLRSSLIRWLFLKVQSHRDMAHLEAHHQRGPNTNQDRLPRDHHHHVDPSTSLHRSLNTSPDLLPHRRSPFTSLPHKRNPFTSHPLHKNPSISQSQLVQLTSLGQHHQNLLISQSLLTNPLHHRSLPTNPLLQPTSRPRKRSQLMPNLPLSLPNRSQPTLLPLNKYTNPPTLSPHM